MISAYFIDRPRFAVVISIITILVGLLALLKMPISQYPPITPPVVEVSASYPGANAEVLEATVATPLEDAINGVEDMIYLSSKSSSSGEVSVSITFKVGTDPNIAQVNVQNRVARAEPSLPQEVRQIGVTVQKRSTDVLLYINFNSPDKSMSEIEISNYASIRVRDALLRVPGVGDVSVFGARDYSMRIWLDPQKMSSRGVTAADVISAIREQNIQVAAGKVGQTPIDQGQQMSYVLRVKGRLHTVEEFEDIIIRAKQNASIIQIRDIGRVELGAENYERTALLDGKPSLTMATYLLPGANALEVASGIREAMASLSEKFPPGLAYTIVYDTTRFVSSAIRDVLFTLGAAVLCVALVIYLFLQDWRSTLIPVITIPVSLIGALAALRVLDYSINTITLFGLILAIGTVVDDAIVVIENVRRLMSEGYSPRQAAIKSMEQVTRPIIATTLVLLAIFVPVGFAPGVTGQLYQQFAVTLSVAVVFSTFNALTLSPALCAVLLKPEGKHNFILRGFEAGYQGVAGIYRRLVHLLLRHVALVLIAFILLIGLTVEGFRLLPQSFLPEEDQGFFLASVQLPEGAALPRTERVLAEAGAYMSNTPGVEHVLQIGGLNLISGTTSSNAGLLVGILKPWSERAEPHMSLAAITAKLQGEFAQVSGANIFAFNPPAIRGLGRTGGFNYQMQDTTGQDIQQFAAIMRGFLARANQTPELAGVFSTFEADVPQIFVDIDRRKVKTLGIPLDDVFQTLQVQLGSYYVNDFNLNGRVFQVRLQSDEQFRDEPEDVYGLYVRGRQDAEVPLQTLVNLKPQVGPDTISHYNVYRAIEINGSAAPGYSSGEAIAAMERLSDELLPQGMTYEWSGLSYQEIEAGTQGPLLALLALLFVYLFLVAQYESWSIPLAVILSVPTALSGAVAAQLISGLYNDIYGQIGMILLIGLASKNAILIVEFAAELHKDGQDTREAAFHAARLRFRAVMMTAISFIVGVIPLVLATGAAAESRHSLGIPVLGGMLAAAVLGTLIVPTLYVFVQNSKDRLFARQPENRR